MGFVSRSAIFASSGKRWSAPASRSSIWPCTAALNFYGLIGPNLAFAGMLLVTLAAAALADHQRSQALAVIAVGGGFLTPFLVGSGENAQLTLFSYDALLVVGTLLLALRHQWLALNALSYALTFMTLTAWAGRHYTADLWLRTLLFLTLFCVLFVIILRKTARTPGATARLVTALLATGPVFYHLAAIAITADHPPAAHVYLIAFTVVGLWLTAEPHRPWIRLVVLFGGFAPLLGTVILPDGITWILPNVVTIVAVASLHTMALLDRSVRQREPLATADLLALHLTGLGLFALLYQALQPAYPDLRGGLAAIIALGAIGLWQWLQVRDHVASLNAAALAFTLAALGVAVQFDGPAVVIGWAAEGAAAVWVGVRVSSVPFQYGGLLLWILAVLKLSEGYFDTPARFSPILNARSLSTLFLIALAYGMAWMFDRDRGGQGGRLRTALHVAASFLSLMWITAEIRSYWDTRDQTLQAFLYEQMMLSLAWGAYGAAVIVRWHATAVSRGSIHRHDGDRSDGTEGVLLRPLGVRRHLPRHRVHRVWRPAGAGLISLSEEATGHLTTRTATVARGRLGCLFEDGLDAAATPPGGQTTPAQCEACRDHDAGDGRSDTCDRLPR